MNNKKSTKGDHPGDNQYLQSSLGINHQPKKTHGGTHAYVEEDGLASQQWEERPLGL